MDKWNGTEVVYVLEASSFSAANIRHSGLVVLHNCALRMRMQRAMQLGSLPGRTFQPRTRRSVHDICKELGGGYFRRAYRMKYSTFKRLANKLRKYIEDATGKTGPKWTNSTRCPPCMRHSMVVCWWLRV